MKHYRSQTAFTLVEVVLAIGVVAFAIVAIIGVIPIGLGTSHSSQDETRAPQIAQDILGSIASQAQSSYPNVKIVQPSTGFSYNIDLTNASGYVLSADNDGKLVANYSASLPYKVTVSLNPAPAGFDAGYASQVTLRIAWPGGAPAANQTVRDFIRVVTKY